ncbi:MAG: AMP-binding protein, partial [Roseibium sp.]
MAGLADVASRGEDTFPKILLRNARDFGTRTAFREKDFGIWQSWTWANVLDEIRSLSLGMKELGLTKGDKVAIVGSNRPRLYWSMVAAQAVGAVPVPVYADSVAEEMAFVLGHAEVRFAVVQDQEQVDKLQSMTDEVPSLTEIIYDEPRGLRDYDHSHLHHFESVQERGRAVLSADAGAADAWVAGFSDATGPDIAVMLYTSGTTGRPKGVMLSFDNLVISGRNGNIFDNLDETEEVLAYLPMAWIGDHVFSLAQAFTAAYCVNCPESMDTIDVDRLEIAPTYFFAPPRVFENMLTSILVRMEDAGTTKKKMFDVFMGVAKRVGERILNGEQVSLKDRALYGLGELLVYGPLKNRMGLTRLKVGYTAGEAIGPEIFQFYRSLGLNLK